VSTECNKTSADACTYVACKEDKTYAKPCVEETLVCGVPVTDDTTIVAAAAASASAALIAGIICAVVVLGGVVGGATVAVYNGAGDDGMSNTSNNPLYLESGNSGTNPLAV
jgi:hypothetical protein